MSATNERVRLLIVGPMPPAMPTTANPIGGAAVNFNETLRQLELRGLHADVVDISRPRVNLTTWNAWRSNVSTLLRLTRDILKRIRRSDVVLVNINAGRAWLLASWIWAICTVWGRPMALRFFGGDFAERYDAYTRLIRWWADVTYMKSALVYVQTRAILRRFDRHGNFRWFPNTRDLYAPAGARRTSARRLIFISQLHMSKGLGEALEACAQLAPQIHLDVYGPRMEDTDFTLFDGYPGATYGGVLRPQQIPSALAEHDVLILPSYFGSEGYPGIVIEALQCGLPVIATRWGGIPEVIEDGTSGLLVAPKSVRALREAIARLAGDPELYDRLCEGARRRGEFFRSRAWYDRMANDLRGLAGGARSRARPRRGRNGGRR